MKRHTIELIDRQGPPTRPADPRYPTGVDLDIARGRQSCTVTLEYPAPERGVWSITCGACGGSYAATAAGRADDPRTVKVPCRGRMKMRDRR